MRFLTILAILLPLGAQAEGPCSVSAISTLKNAKALPELRAEAASCLIPTSLREAEVAKAVLQIIRDPNEDLFLREDLVEYLGQNSFRRTTRVEGTLGKTLNTQEKEAVDRTLASANNLLAVAQAVKGMDEVSPVTKFENEIFRALSEIAQDENNHVLLRAEAVKALEKISQSVVASGLYDEKTIRMAQETLRVIALRSDDRSYHSGAVLAYNRMVNAGLPGYQALNATADRTIASTPEKR